MDESDGLEHRCASHSRQLLARSYERSSLVQGGFSCFSDTPIGKAPGVGTGDGGGAVSEVEAGCEQITPSEIQLCVGWLHGVPGCGFLVGVGNVQNGGLAPWPASNL